MELERAIIKGNTWFGLSGHTFIDYRPNKKIQLLLGTNGSGKTTLMMELFPNPSPQQAYKHGGYKVLIYKHNGSRYILINQFATGANRFWFKKDGVELNPGGTVSAYKLLVEKEFGITPDIQRLQVGKRPFHELSVAERRALFNRIDHIDHSYSMAYFMRLKSAIRDAQANIKHNQERLLEESKKFISQEQEEKLRSEIDFLKTFLNDCLELKHPVTKHIGQLASEQKVLMEQIKQHRASMVKLRLAFSNEERFSSSDDIDRVLSELTKKAGYVDAQIHTACEQIHAIQVQLDALRKSNSGSLADIDQQIVDLNEEILQLVAMIRLPIDFEDYQAAQQTLDQITPSLLEIVTSLPNNPEKKINRQHLLLLTERLEKNHLTQEANKKSIHYNQTLAAQYLKAKEAEETECPKCQYRWRSGFHQKDYDSTQLTIAQGETALTRAREEEKEIQQELEQVREYLTLFSSFSQLVKSTAVLEGLWNYIVETGVIYTAPSSIPNLLQEVKHYLDIRIKIQKLTAREKELTELKDKTKLATHETAFSLEDKIAILNAHVYQLQKMHNDHQYGIDRLQTYKRVIQRYQTTVSALESALAKYDANDASFRDVFQQEQLNNLINATKLELSERESVIARINTQRVLVEQIETQITKLREKHRLLTIAAKELSPSDGIIARNITGFINRFITQVNSFVGKVWSYPVSLNQIRLDEHSSSDLDYRFEVQIKDFDPVPDIADASKGQREILDLAIMIIVMQYVLNRVPLFLDELGANFDKAHRGLISNLIQELSQYDNFSHIFVISHYSEVYGSFKNADVVVMCPDNIEVAQLGQAYNEVISFEEEEIEFDLL